MPVKLAITLAQGFVRNTDGLQKMTPELTMIVPLLLCLIAIHHNNGCVTEPKRPDITALLRGLEALHK
jgi:hypothetical protein